MSFPFLCTFSFGLKLQGDVAVMESGEKNGGVRSLIHHKSFINQYTCIRAVELCRRACGSGRHIPVNEVMCCVQWLAYLK